MNVHILCGCKDVSVHLYECVLLCRRSFVDHNPAWRRSGKHGSTHTQTPSSAGTGSAFPPPPPPSILARLQRTPTSTPHTHTHTRRQHAQVNSTSTGAPPVALHSNHKSGAALSKSAGGASNHQGAHTSHTHKEKHEKQSSHSHTHAPDVCDEKENIFMCTARLPVPLPSAVDCIETLLAASTCGETPGRFLFVLKTVSARVCGCV